MEKFFELRMKNGISFIVATNKDGICQFSINGMEYSIYTCGAENQSLTFSIGKTSGKGQNNQAMEGLEVLSLREINSKKKTGVKNFFNNTAELKSDKIKRSFLWWKQNFYSANKGGVCTPDGWIVA